MKTAADLRDELEASLRKLRRDVIDVYHLHRVRPSDYAYCREELVPELLALRDEGKIRFNAISESTGSDPGHATLQRSLDNDFWDVVMIGFNLFNQSPRKIIFPATTAKNIGVEVMASARSYFSRDDVLVEKLERMIVAGALDRDLDPVKTVEFLREAGSGKLSRISYRFAADEPGVHTVLVGTGNLAHLQENVDALSCGTLPPETRQQIIELFGHLSLAVEAPSRAPTSHFPV